MYAFQRKISKVNLIEAAGPKVTAQGINRRNFLQQHDLDSNNSKSEEATRM